MLAVIPYADERGGRRDRQRQRLRPGRIGLDHRSGAAGTSPGGSAPAHRHQRVCARPGRRPSAGSRPAGSAVNSAPTPLPPTRTSRRSTRNAGAAGISSVSSGIVSGGTSGTHSGLRATINAWLEDISFARTGMIAGVVVLLLVAAVGAAAALLSHDGQAATALDSRSTTSPATVAAPSVGGAAQPPRDARPRDACPVRSGRSSAARSAGASVPGTGSPQASPATEIRPGRSGFRYQPGELPADRPAGWRHGPPLGWGQRGDGPGVPTVAAPTSAARGGDERGFCGARPGLPAAPGPPWPVTARVRKTASAPS